MSHLAFVFGFSKYTTTILHYFTKGIVLIRFFVTSRMNLVMNVKPIWLQLLLHPTLCKTLIWCVTLS